MDNTMNTDTSYLIMGPGGRSVTLADRAALDTWLAAKGLKVTATKRTIRIPLKAEIEGQPIVGGLLGPLSGGPGVCRYESTTSVAI